jgi:hypothetical protein
MIEGNDVGDQGSWSAERPHSRHYYHCHHHHDIIIIIIIMRIIAISIIIIAFSSLPDYADIFKKANP